MIEHMHWGFHAVLMFLSVLIVIGLGSGLYLVIENILVDHRQRQLRAKRDVPGPVIRSASFDTLKKSRGLPSLSKLR